MFSEGISKFWLWKEFCVDLPRSGSWKSSVIFLNIFLWYYAESELYISHWNGDNSPLKQWNHSFMQNSIREKTTNTPFSSKYWCMNFQKCLECQFLYLISNHYKQIKYIYISIFEGGSDILFSEITQVPFSVKSESYEYPFPWMVRSLQQMCRSVMLPEVLKRGSILCSFIDKQSDTIVWDRQDCFPKLVARLYSDLLRW